MYTSIPIIVFTRMILEITMYLLTIKVRHDAQPHDPDGDCADSQVQAARAMGHSGERYAREPFTLWQIRPCRFPSAMESREQGLRDDAAPDMVRDFTPVASCNPRAGTKHPLQHTDDEEARDDKPCTT